jgi:hypothetical protein
LIAWLPTRGRGSGERAALGLETVLGAPRLAKAADISDG